MGLRTFIVGGGTLAREGLKTILSSTPDFEVVGDADHPGNLGDPSTLEAEILLIIPSVEFKEMQTLLETSSSKNRKIILIAENGNERELIDIYGPMVDAVITDDISKADLVMVLSLLLRGFVVFPQEVKATLSDLMSALPDVPAELRVHPPKLTRREREVLLLLADNLTNQEIARELGISVSAARDHVARVIRKLRQPTRHLAVLCARHIGLLEKPSMDGPKALAASRHGP